ncbi:MAG: hypothetical protein ABJE10_24315 [bacterium]
MSGRRLSLLSDHSLVVEYDATVARFVEPWMPRHAGATPSGANARAVIRISSRENAHTDDTSRLGADVTMRLGAATAMFTAPDVVRLAARWGAHGEIHLGTLRADIVVPAGVSGGLEPDQIADTYSLLTLASALLINRLSAALVHAGAAVSPAGCAWVIAGDTHAGKTTTCITLVAAGWRFLADDQVVLRRDASGALTVEGWPRIAHVDPGWSSGTTTGARADVDLESQWPESWQPSAPLGGFILPSVRADAPTSARIAKASDALTAAIRQSPWLMADRVGASDVLALLSAAVTHPAITLSLGNDSYGKASVLERVISSAIDGA